MGERIALVVNPAATRSSPQLIADVVAALRPLGLFEVATTRWNGHASELAAAARDRGATLVVTLGGDGTVNEVASALAGTDVALAPLPAGSTNVFARALGWPHPARRTLPALVAALAGPAWRPVVLGRVRVDDRDRLFCINAGVGVDAETVHLVEARPWIKTRFRHAGFAATTLVAAVRAARRPPVLTVSVDEGPPDTFTALIVACGSPYAFFGPRPLELVPGADFRDELRWIGLRDARLRTVGAVVGGALRGGRHIQRAAVASGRATALRVAAGAPVAVHADGEPLGKATEVLLTTGPTLRALRPPPVAG